MFASSDRVLKLAVGPVLLAALGSALDIPVSTLTQITDFGDNPTGVENYVYVPATLADPPALIAAIHYCTGTAQAYYSGTEYATLAEKYGYIVLYPEAPAEGKCWDVHTDETLTHDAGGDSLGIANGLRYLVDLYGVDSEQVFATGTSSGAMMTNVLAGAYPDLIKAGAAFAGVPYACFAGESAWSTECAQGQLIKSGEEWGALALAGYAGYTGTRPKMALWHGSVDTTLNTQNYYEEIKQWTNIFGVSENATSVTEDWPISGWTLSEFGDNVQGILASGVDHNIPVQAQKVLEWFGIA